MNPVPFILLALSLPLLLGGCVGKNEGINWDELDFREGYTIAYLKGSDTLYTGKAVLWHDNGQKQVEVNFKDGKRNGLYVSWHENGEKRS
ncbi:MAG TPA: hypothetical protein EYQ23_04125, partial [Verrucomicrobiales bacterium]|nr:hypothetical protein [Verrucomicrobiales bacterium]